MSEEPRSLSPHDGVIATESSPGVDALYVTPDELTALTGLECSEETIRFACAIVDAHCCRRTLWPSQYEEQLPVAEDRYTIQLSVTPVLKLLAVNGRFTPGRRNNRRLTSGGLDYLTIAAVSGSPPRWTPLDINGIDLVPATGEAWLPTGLFLISWSQVRVSYIAGFPTIPNRVKMALAEILHTISSKGQSDLMRLGVGRLTRQFASDTFLTRQAEQFLEPCVVHSLM
jgi:hypothetical protein